MIDECYAQQLDDALQFMKNGDNFLIVSHVQPDGDAISSTVVVAWMLEKLGKRAVLVNEGELPARLQYLDGFERIVSYKATPLEQLYDCVIAVDCADFRRIGEVANSFAPNAQLLNIDHHPTNNEFGTVNIVYSKAAATVEILYEMIQKAEMTLDTKCAEAIYTGLLTDTGGFRYSNTSARVMEIASELLAAGVNGNRLADHLLEKMTMGKLKLLQLSLSRLTFNNENTIGWVYIGKDDIVNSGGVPEDLEGIVNYALNVDGVEVGILFKETKDGAVKVSLRSAGKADVAAIAQTFGGGGHVRAAGLRLEDDMPTAINRVVEAVRKALEQ